MPFADRKDTGSVIALSKRGAASLKKLRGAFENDFSRSRGLDSRLGDRGMTGTLLKGPAPVEQMNLIKGEGA